MHKADDTKFSRLLVTGGAGFIGSEFVRSSLSGSLFGGKPSKITVVDALTYAGDMRRLSTVSRNDGLVFVKADIKEELVMTSLIAEHDAIIHFAAESHVDRSIERSKDFIQSNIVGTHTILEIAKNLSKVVVLVSTDEVYGSLDSGSADETFPLKPASPYSASKAAGDLLGMAYATTYGLDVRITRSANNYGRYQDCEKLLPKLVTNLSKNVKIPIYGDGSNIRNWIHIQDHCEAIARVLHLGSAGEIYNIGSEESYRNIDLAKLLLDYFRLSEDMIEYVTDRKGHDFRYAINSDKATKLLNWKPKRKLLDSISEILAGIQFLS
ncbi:MAG: NAD-dependent epimerase/dehydratase family protein [Actinobacteria bacterium]|nr:NAD-dependent epimerase/dehydratase family protein [Actinomycetota bacterium]MSX24731.1 NAD-dependent epimerase/dehydratase family protein [Actinomycetota bacterium]MSY45913.1 NAD-dependent epimerase/dehydratase family protein [Actinomycetota bacterium]MSY56861.1 NAD-dependent epimerase/dehydratase family protein [Actinomycetota bacterium]MTB00536.1 NAD-dependent epimerase/dehydratase family protein [Actinomycetota bacterium]